MTAGRGIDRRRSLALLSGAAALPFLNPSFARASAFPSDDIRFTVSRKGDVIGTHTVRFEPRGEDVGVTVEVDLKVKIGFITAFSFNQVAHDVWRDGILMESRVETNDDGDESEVVVRADGSRLIVNGNAGDLAVPIGTMTDLCFWNPGIVNQRQLIAAGKGKLATIEANAGQPERLVIGDREVDTMRYHVASNGRDGDIWYDGKGRWVQGIIRPRGEELAYALEA